MSPQSKKVKSRNQKKCCFNSRLKAWLRWKKKNRVSPKVTEKIKRKKSQEGCGGGVASELARYFSPPPRHRVPEEGVCVRRTRALSTSPAITLSVFTQPDAATCPPARHARAVFFSRGEARGDSFNCARRMRSRGTRIIVRLFFCVTLVITATCFGRDSVVLW